MPLSPEKIAEIRSKAGLSPSLPKPDDSVIQERLREFDSIASQGADEKSAQNTSATFPAKLDTDNPAVAGVKALGNVPSSIYNLGKGVVKSLAHPIDTINGIADAAKGGAETAVRAVAEHTPLGDIKLHSGASLRDTIHHLAPDQEEKTFKAVVDSLKERYGSLENAQRTATNDPFGFGADVLSLVTGGASVAGKIPGVANLAVKAGEIAKPLTTAVSDINTATREAAAAKLNASAGKNLETVLAPTKENMKVMTQQVLPQLVERKKFAWTRKGLESKVANEIEASGQAIDEAWQALPPGTTEQVKPVIDALESSKSKFVVDGTVVEPGAWKAADELQKTILSVAKDSPEISSESLRRVRQIWDESINRSKGFTRDMSEQDALAIKKEATAAIRKVLSDAHPEIAKVNAEYTLWKKVGDILEETAKRKTGQSGPAIDKLKSAGAGIGIGSSQGLKEGALAAGAVAGIAMAMKSTAWNTFSAIQKAKLAEAIVRGSQVDVMRILKPIIGDQAMVVNNEIQDKVGR